MNIDELGRSVTSSSMFMVESVQLLGPYQKDATKAALQQLVTFAAESLDGQVGKRGTALAAWPEGASPGAAAHPVSVAWFGAMQVALDRPRVARDHGMAQL